MTRPRFPLDPLLATTGLLPTHLARQVRASGATMARARRSGLSVYQADKWAVRLGLHPALVWPGWALA